MFWKKPYAHQACIYLIKNTEYKNTVKTKIIKIKKTVLFQDIIKMQFIPSIAKLNFQQPLLQSSVSHDP